MCVYIYICMCISVYIYIYIYMSVCLPALGKPLILLHVAGMERCGVCPL